MAIDGWSLEDLFSVLWTEVDFDDHPFPGSHAPVAEGDLIHSIEGDTLFLADDRIRFAVHHRIDDSAVADQHPRIDHDQRPLKRLLLSTGCHSTAHLNGFMPWSLPRSWLPSGEYTDSEIDGWLRRGAPEKQADQVDDRTLLRRCRADLKHHLKGWTWHLEIGNKTDRLGWYVRTGADSLFTIFIGLGWDPDHPADRAGFLLFERAPEGELDRSDEYEMNQTDVGLTHLLCRQGGALSELGGSVDLMTATERIRLDLPGDVRLWPPGLGHWPLLMARSDDDLDDDSLIHWFSLILTALEDAIDLVTNS